MRWSKRKLFLLGFPRQHTSYAFLSLVLSAFMVAGFYAGHRNHSLHGKVVVTSEDDETAFNSPSLFSFSALESASVLHEHPIPKLMEEAERKYREKLARQSKTLPDAVTEYKNRYKRDPPKGFDEWWDFAQENDARMVDNYDGLMNDLEPFWNISGEEVRRRAHLASELPFIDVVRLQDGVSFAVNFNHESEISARTNGFRRMLQKFEHKLSDMIFPINAKAESRVLVPWEHRLHPNISSPDGVEASTAEPFRPDWGDDGSVWEEWRRACPPDSAARRLFSSLRSGSTTESLNYLEYTSNLVGDDFSFSSKTASSFDFCNQPYAHQFHGHFFSDWRSIPFLYPVFSPAKAKGFMDIRIPSHYYYGSTPQYTYGWDPVNLELKSVDPMEVPWEDKINKIFWRGATTGGGNHPPGFTPQYQRHRFVRMASDDSSTNRTITYADPPDSEHYISTPVPIGRLNEDIMDTAFVKATEPDAYPGGLEALTKDHKFSDSVPLGKHWSYKYLMDLDGMSYSGRFLAFLASDSVPIKATVYDEYFSDWMQPWLHFIPISQTYKELYNLFVYFSGPTDAALEIANSTTLKLPVKERKYTEGDKRLRRIARAGKQWKRTIGRTIDMEIYVYRLCLEWARLWTDDRDSMNFSL